MSQKLEKIDISSPAEMNSSDSASKFKDIEEILDTCDFGRLETQNKKKLGKQIGRIMEQKRKNKEVLSSNFLDSLKFLAK